MLWQQLEDFAMPKIYRLLSATGSVGFLLAAAVTLYPQSAAARMLSGRQIEYRIIGNSRTGETSNGSTRYCEYYNPNGQIRGFDGGPGLKPEYYTGSWQISGNRLCFDYAGTQYDVCVTLSIHNRFIRAYNTDGSLRGHSLLVRGDACD